MCSARGEGRHPQAQAAWRRGRRRCHPGRPRAGQPPRPRHVGPGNAHSQKTRRRPAREGASTGVGDGCGVGQMGAARRLRCEVAIVATGNPHLNARHASLAEAAEEVGGDGGALLARQVRQQLSQIVALLLCGDIPRTFIYRISSSAPSAGRYGRAQRAWAAAHRLDQRLAQRRGPHRAARRTARSSHSRLPPAGRAGPSDRPHPP